MNDIIHRDMYLYNKVTYSKMLTRHVAAQYERDCMRLLNQPSNGSMSNNLFLTLYKWYTYVHISNKIGTHSLIKF